MISAIDTSSQRGRRDHALLLFLYNTGARVTKLWRRARVIFDWNGLGTCDCWVRERRSGSAHSGRKPPLLCVESFTSKQVANQSFKAVQVRP